MEIDPRHSQPAVRQAKADSYARRLQAELIRLKEAMMQPRDSFAVRLSAERKRFTPPAEQMVTEDSTVLQLPDTSAPAPLVEDQELAALNRVWPKLSRSVKSAIMAVVKSQSISQS